MKTLLLTLLFCVTLNAQNQDKTLHFVAGMGAGTFTATINDATELKLPNAVAHIGGAVAIGTIKELSDKKFDEKDLTATALGGVLSYAIDELFGKSKYSRIVVIGGSTLYLGITLTF